MVVVVASEADRVVSVPVVVSVLVAVIALGTTGLRTRQSAESGEALVEERR